MLVDPRVTHLLGKSIPWQGRFIGPARIESLALCPQVNFQGSNKEVCRWGFVGGQQARTL